LAFVELAEYQPKVYLTVKWHSATSLHRQDAKESYG